MYETGLERGAEGGCADDVGGVLCDSESAGVDRVFACDVAEDGRAEGVSGAVRHGKQPDRAEARGADCEKRFSHLHEQQLRRQTDLLRAFDEGVQDRTSDDREVLRRGHG